MRPAWFRTWSSSLTQFFIVMRLGRSGSSDLNSRNTSSRIRLNYCKNPVRRVPACRAVEAAAGLRSSRERVGALDALGERRGEETVDVAVEHRAGVARLHPGA